MRRGNIRRRVWITVLSNLPVVLNLYVRTLAGYIIHVVLYVNLNRSNT